MSFERHSKQLNSGSPKKVRAVPQCLWCSFPSTSACYSNWEKPVLVSHALIGNGSQSPKCCDCITLWLLQVQASREDYLHVTFDGVNGSNAKHNKLSWNSFFHSLVPVSAFHRTNDDGEWSTTSKS